jgi:hypothetical protein
MDNNELDIKAFKRLQYIHLTFCIIMILLIVIILLLNQLVSNNIINRNDNTLLYIAFFATCMFPIISNSIFHRRLEGIDLDEPVKFRLKKFIHANIMRYIWIIGAGIINVMMWYLTATLLLAIFNGFLLLVLLIIRPVKFKVIRILRLRPTKV